MAKKRYPSSPPQGKDELWPAEKVRQDRWIQDPFTDEWVRVKQMSTVRTGCFGPDRDRDGQIRLSLSKLGERNFPPDTMLVVRVGDDEL